MLKLYGDGPDLEVLKKMCVDLEIEQNVKFMGSCNNAVDILADSKLTVLTSDYEGIPNGVLDAMAIGIPVVATDASPGGVRFLITNGEDGLVVPRGNVDAVAEAIITLLDSPELADAISTKSREVNERFTQEKIVSMWENYIDSL